MCTAIFYANSFTYVLDKEEKIAVINIFFMFNSWMNQVFDLGAMRSVCRGGGTIGAAVIYSCSGVCITII